MIPTDRVYIIAEAGVNHNGSLQMAKELIDAAAEAGADAIKFQSFTAERLVTINAPKAEYQIGGTDPHESQFEMLRRLELNEASFEALLAHAKQYEIDFFSSLFDLECVSLAQRLDYPCLKIPSGEITNAPLLLGAAHTGKPIIISTGMSNLGEIEMALGVLSFGYLHSPEQPSLEAFAEAYRSKQGRNTLKRQVTLLHCTSEYPASYDNVHLRALDTLRDTFELSVGYSDHTSGIAISIAAAARGASVIEKHITVDRHLPGPDHKASLEPNELKAMVQSIRQVEKALGLALKSPVQSEIHNRWVVRKSLVAAKDISKGEVFTMENLTFKRPAEGISPIFYWDWLGKPARKDYGQDEVIER